MPDAMKNDWRAVAATQQHYAAATWPTFPPPRTILVAQKNRYNLIDIKLSFDF